MTDRIPSDHDTIERHRTRLAQVGRTHRPKLALPDAVDATVGDVVRLSLEGDTYHAQVTESLDGDREIRGAFTNGRLARTDGEGTNHLQTWTESTDLTAGDPLVVDVVTPGFKFGLRRPGERVVYTATDAPSSSLADIARDIDG